MNDHHDNLEKARRLAQLLVAPRVPEDCTECLAALEAYVDLQLAGQDYLARYPAIVRHLDSCVRCAEDYGLLYEGRLAEAAPPVPSRVPKPDLTFLRSSQAEPAPREASAAAGQLAQALARAVARAGHSLRLRLSQGLLDALAALAPPSAPAPALRSADEVEPLLELELTEPGEEIERLRLLAYPQQTPDLCSLRISVSLHGRDWPDLAGVVISIYLPGSERRVVSDAWGEAVVEDIPLAALPDLQLQIDTVSGSSS